MMKSRSFKNTFIYLSLILAFSEQSLAAVKISDVPLDVALNSANSIMAVDNSGSMDLELLISGHDSGAAFWTGSAFSGTYSSNSFWYSYLFPMNIESGYSGDRHFFSDGVIPPFSSYAYFRSSDYNALYYNPKLTYTPWPNAVIGGNDTNFVDAPTNAARTHPYFTAATDNNSGTATTFNLQSSYFGSSTSPVANCSDLSNSGSTDLTNSFWSFTVLQGMSVDSSAQPSGSGTSYKVCYRAWNTPRRGTSSWTNWQDAASPNAADISGGTAQRTLQVMIPYNPATFWMKDSTCTSGWPACATDPNGNRYKRFDINSLTGSSYTLPDGTVINRTKAQELQNFANWFTYYRKRKLMMAGGMGKALDTLQDNYRQLSAAFMPYHSYPAISSSSPKIYDFTNSAKADNGRALSGLFYSLHTEGGTPTIAALNRSGTVYGYDGPFESYLTNKSSTDSITNRASAEAALRCSANTSFVITDGFANDYSGSNTIFSTAKTYYDGLRWWGPAGGTNGNVGKTMNTYGITLGALGTVYNGNTDAAEPSTWPNPQDDDPRAIDDLWHAAKYSKGKLLSASDPTALESSISRIITDMFSAGSGTGLSYSDAKIQTDNNIVIQAGYNSGNWTGELAAFSVYTTGSNAGYVNYSDKKWSAKQLLNAKSSRSIATWSGSDGIPFTSTALQDAGLLSTFNTGSVSDGAAVVAWLRGDRSAEGTTYRKRDDLLGDIVNSTPVYVNEAFANYSYAGYSTFAARAKSRTDMVYVGANDGMLHAFRASDGEEMWAYVPKLVHSELNSLSQPAYLHKFTVDGQLTAWDVEFDSASSSSSSSTSSSSASSASADTSSKWRTILIGGLRAGGKGYFALDITNPVLQGTTDAEKEQDLAAKVLWEFTDTNMGLSFGKPVIAKTESYGWVALLPSGYNTADGKGHLYVVNAQTGALIKDMVINLTSGAAFDQVGLATVQGVIDYTAAISSQDTALLKYAYGGDLNGNLWRFNLRDANRDNWSVKKLATNLNGSNETGKAPITAAPDIALINTPGPFPSYQNTADLKTQRLMIYVGNGKLLHSDDFNVSDNNGGFYAIEDADDALVIGEGACASFNCMVQVGLGSASSSLGLNNWGTSLNSSLTSWWVVDRHSFNWNGAQRVKRGWYIKFSETGGERIINPPVVYNGKVLFTTTMKTDTRHTSAGACEQTFSALYNLSADKGGTESLSYPSRINLGFGIASGVSIIQLPDGSTRATGAIKQNSTSGLNTTGGSATACTGEGCNFSTNAGGQSVAANVKMKRYGWREIYR